MIDLKAILKGWNEFWFAPESPVPVAVFRILFGLIVLQFCWFMSGELHSLLGQKAIVSQAAASAWDPNARINLLAWLVHSDGALDVFWIVFTLAAACLALGLCTRLSAVIVYLCLISCDARNPFIFTGADNMLRVESFLLVFSQCGAALSLDRLLSVWLCKKGAQGPARPGNPWALRLLQVQIALCYWAAYSSKITGGTWIDGSAVYYVTHIVEENRYALPYVYDHIWTCRLLSWSTLAIEFSLAALIWFKELRLPLIITGILFHAMLDFTLIIPQFQTVMIASLISFIEPGTYARMAGWARAQARRLAGEPLVAVYDGSFDLSRRLAETVRRLDVFALVKLIDLRQASAASAFGQPPALPQAGEVLVTKVSGQGWDSGLRALTRVAWRLPLVCILCPLLYMPGLGPLLAGIARLFRRLYPGRAPVLPESAA